jgi:hypothetical protein
MIGNGENKKQKDRYSRICTGQSEENRQETRKTNAVKGNGSVRVL